MMAPPRLVVLAYHDLGAACLEELLRAGEDVALVVTHDDAPGENVWWRSVRQLAEHASIPVVAPANVNAPDVVERVRSLEPDFLFSFMFRQLLGKDLLGIPRRGAFNLHPSLLPRLRGRSPINWALVLGERETGVTLHEMVEKADRGDILAQRSFPIGEEDTASTLHRRATEEARILMRETWPLLRAGHARRTPQDPSRASYYGGRRPEDGEIDWRWPARRIYDLVRAVTHPYPGAFTWRDGRRFFVWWAKPVAGDGRTPSGVLAVEPDGGVLVGAGEGALRLERVQPEGEAETDAAAWAAAAGVRTGERFGKES